MTPIGATRNHGVSQIHRPGTDHRSAFDPGSLTSEAPAATEGFITEANMETTDLARVTSLSRALNDSTVLAIRGGAR